MSINNLFNNPIEKRELQIMLEDFCNLTGLAAVISDSQGNMLTELSNASAFCKEMRRIDNLCSRSDEIGGKIAALSGEVCIYKCHAGLVDLAVPVFFGDEHIGNILAGQVRTSLSIQLDLSETYFQTIKNLTNEQKILLERIPSMDQERLEKFSKILDIIRKYIVERIKVLRYQRERGLDSPQLDNYNQFKSKVGTIVACIESIKYDVGKSLLKELIEQYIVTAQMELTKKLYWNIFNYEMMGLKLDIYKDESFKSSFIGEPEIGRKYYELYDCVFDYILKHKVFKVSDDMNYAIAYIQRYHYKKINYSMIAKFMNFSPDYLSRIFKERFGYSIVDYINRYKVEQAMNLLSSSDLTIQTIALELGFNEPNYFSKIFKQIIGVTPSDFRSQNMQRLIECVNKITE